MAKIQPTVVRVQALRFAAEGGQRPMGVRYNTYAGLERLGYIEWAPPDKDLSPRWRITEKGKQALAEWSRELGMDK